MRWLIAAIVVQHSNTASCAGPGHVVEVVVDPDRVVAELLGERAISTALSHFAAAPSIDASSIFQPWGMNTPNTIPSSHAGRTLCATCGRMATRGAGFSSVPARWSPEFNIGRCTRRSPPTGPTPSAWCSATGG